MNHEIAHTTGCIRSNRNHLATQRAGPVALLSLKHEGGEWFANRRQRSRSVCKVHRLAIHREQLGNQWIERVANPIVSDASKLGSKALTNSQNLQLCVHQCDEGQALL